MSGRSRFAIASIALTLAIAAFAPAVAHATGIGVETAIFLVAAPFALAIGLGCGERFDALERRTREDPVTRVGNRRHWEERLADEVDRATRSRMPLALLLLDVDNLKQLNDTHGHGCGDRALKLVGEVLLDTCRSRDVAARFGGDEFAVLLPRTRVDEAKVVAARIRAELARRRGVLGVPFDAALTVSVGIADLDSAPERTRAGLFESADLALYAAKRGGRDRVHVREPAAISGVIRLDAVRARKSKIGRAGA
jgi:diguanylate cyclase (GGDEF)-like protein